MTIGGNFNGSYSICFDGHGRSPTSINQARKGELKKNGTPYNNIVAKMVAAGRTPPDSLLRLAKIEKANADALTLRSRSGSPKPKQQRRDGKTAKQKRREKHERHKAWLDSLTPELLYAHRQKQAAKKRRACRFKGLRNAINNAGVILSKN